MKNSMFVFGLSVAVFAPTLFADMVKFWDRRDTIVAARSADTKYPLPVTPYGEVNLASDMGQVTCAAASTALTTKSCLVVDLVATSANTAPIFYKVGTVTTANGAFLPPGAGVTLGVNEDLNTLSCISASGTEKLSYTCLVK